MLVQCDPANEDLLIAAMWEAGTAGIAEEPGGFRAFFEDHIPIGLVRHKLPRPPAGFRLEDQTDWAAVTRQAFPPLYVGRRFFLVPPWCTDPTPPGRLRLVINPGMACGTGQHPCTRLCLEALEKYMKPGDRVLDVGSGSGILSQAARLLGAVFVAGCDLDADVRPPFAGSAAAVRSASMDLIVSNISAAAVDDLDPEFQRVLKPSSILIVSGFTEPEIPAGFPVHARLQLEGWVCLVAIAGSLVG